MLKFSGCYSLPGDLKNQFTRISVLLGKGGSGAAKLLGRYGFPRVRTILSSWALKVFLEFH
jgi:hypothetical protein